MVMLSSGTMAQPEVRENEVQEVQHKVEVRCVENGRVNDGR